MSRRKVCVVITARPSFSRIKTALTAIRDHPELDLQLVVAASTLLRRHGSAADYIEDEFDVAARVFMVLEGDNPAAMAKTTGLGVLELTTAFCNLRPDVVVTVADRYETMATAIAAAYLNIPLAHVQGGEVTGSIDEKVRHAVTKMADLHLPATPRAAERIIRMGEDPATVFVTGCPSIDLAREVLEDSGVAFDPFERYGGVGPRLDLSDGYLIVIQHPVTTEYRQARAHVEETLHVVRDMAIPTLWFWPNADAGADGTSEGIRAFRELQQPENIHFFKNMMPLDFLRLLLDSRCIVGNSSVGIRECSFLGLPAVNIGSRQAGRERGRNVLDVDYRREEIREAITVQLKNGRFPPDRLYGDGQAGQRIAAVLAAAELRIDKRLRY